MRYVQNLAGVVVAHILIVSASCYEPSLQDCRITCRQSADCVGDQTCVDGFCAGANVARCASGEPVIVDASAATGPDARDLCSQGCSNGTCIAGVCTIDCSLTGSCENDVVCPANLPCHVICGDMACGHKINCTQAASCTVDCVGERACADEIQCPSNRDCNVTCSGDNSCERRTKCSSSCACDVTCSGAGSCNEASECPSSTCRVGNGCSSQPAGCDTCP